MRNRYDTGLAVALQSKKITPGKNLLLWFSLDQSPLPYLHTQRATKEKLEASTEIKAEQQTSNLL